MSLFSKMDTYRIGWVDVALTKITVFFATLWLAKLWDPLLSLEWYWYLVLWILFAIRPVRTAYRWLRSNQGMI